MKAPFELFVIPFDQSTAIVNPEMTKHDVWKIKSGSKKILRFALCLHPWNLAARYLKAPVDAGVINIWLIVYLNLNLGFYIYIYIYSTHFFSVHLFLVYLS